MTINTEIEKFNGTWYQQANESEKQIFRDWIRGLLKTEDVTLTFKKQDGTIRKLVCTLNGDKLPIMENASDKKAKPLSNDVLTVFDLEIKQWRSCRFDSISKIEFILGK